MEGSAKVKVPGGKLVAVKVEYNSAIEKIKITGDFFMYPESALGELEKILVGVNVGESEENLAYTVYETLHRSRVTMIGVTPEAIASAIKRAVSK
ncbi:MAG TPA: hypothetical protein VL944_01940 [Candidatus Acidoferrum sp.]|nr:hypothetical protein [Candidatus Acidoferrum sp.]